MLVLGAIPAFAAPGARVATATDTGQYIVSPSLSRTVKKPQKLWAVTTTSAPGSIELDYTVSCTRGLHYDYQQGGQNVASGAVVKLPKPVSKPHDCHVSLTSTYEDFDSDADVTVAIELRATKQKRL